MATVNFSEQVNNLRNIVKIPGGYKGSVHAQISGYYNSKSDFTNGVSVRDWLSTKTFEEQLAFGLKELRKYGTITETEIGWIFTPFN